MTLDATVVGKEASHVARQALLRARLELLVQLGEAGNLKVLVQDI